MPSLSLPLPVHSKVSLAGSGGKSSLIEALAASVDGRKIISTTTHIRRGLGDELRGESKEEIRNYFKNNPESKLYVGVPTEDNKLSAPQLSPDELSELCDYLFIEADGSKGLPFKAHRSFEPKEPEGFFKIYVMGASALERPISEVCHGAELLAQRLGVSINDKLSPRLAFSYLKWELEQQIIAPDILCINQIDCSEESQLKELLSLIEKSSFSFDVWTSCLKNNN